MSAAEMRKIAEQSSALEAENELVQAREEILRSARDGHLERYFFHGLSASVVKVLKAEGYKVGVTHGGGYMVSW